MPLVSKAFGDIITFTRASTGSFFNSAGVLQSSAINAPRLDYDPSTLAAQGLLIEEQRTNSIRNNTMVGAVAGTPGTNPTNWTITAAQNGITKTIVGVGTENGISYVDIQYTTGGGNTSGAGTLLVIGDLSTQITAASGQTWTSSFYLKLQAGSTANLTSVVTNVAERTAAGSLLASTTLSVSPTSAALATQRNVLTRLLSDAATERVSAAIFSASYASGVAIDITLRIGLPQLELGAFATSVIPTTTAAVTRSADLASVNTLSPWFNAVEGTVYTEYSLPALNSAAAQNAIFISDNTSSNRNSIRTSSPSSNNAGVIFAGGVVQSSLGSTVAAINVTQKIASAYKANDFAYCDKAGTVQTDTSGTIPTVTQMQLGNGLLGDFLNGYLRRITFYPRRLGNTELQAITS